MPSNLLLDRGYDLTLRRSDTHFLANPDLRQLKQLFEPAHHQIQVRWQQPDPRFSQTNIEKQMIICWLRRGIAWPELVTHNGTPLSILVSGQQVVDITLYAEGRSVRLSIGYKHQHGNRLDSQFEVGHLPIQAP